MITEEETSTNQEPVETEIQEQEVDVAALLDRIKGLEAENTKLQNVAKSAFEKRDQVKKKYRTLKQGQSQEDSPAMNVAQELEALRAQVDAQARRGLIRDYADEVGAKVSRKMLDRVVKLSQLEDPEDVHSWLSETFNEMGLIKAEAKEEPKKAARPPDGRPVSPVTNSGTPAVDMTTNLPLNPMRIDPAMFKGMSSQERKDRAEKYLSSLGFNSNAFAKPQRK
jgi:hypothetical protein